MKKSIISILAFMTFSIQAQAFFDETGAPKAVHCKASVLVADSDINGKTDINKLLMNSTTESLPSINPQCAAYQGDTSGGCQAVIDTGKIYLRYAFNTQNGGITVEDKVTGQSTYQSWYTQFGVTQSGYLTATAWLTNTKGGLGGNPRAFRIQFSCQAVGSDWNK